MRKLLIVLPVLFFLPVIAQTDPVALSEWRDAQKLIRYADSLSTMVKKQKHKHKKGRSCIKSRAENRTVRKKESISYREGMVVKIQKIKLSPKNELRVRLENDKPVMISKKREGYRVYSFTYLGGDKWLWLYLPNEKDSRFQQKIVTGIKQQLD